MPHPSIHHIVRKKELHKRNIQTNKRNFHHMFRITKLVSLARHAHDDHHFVQMGLFGKGEYPRHLGVPTPPKQEATSDTSMKRSSPNHTGERYNLPLLRQRRGRSMHESDMAAQLKHRSGATPPLPLKKWQEDHCKHTSSPPLVVPSTSCASPLARTPGPSATLPTRLFPPES